MGRGVRQSENTIKNDREEGTETDWTRRRVKTGKIGGPETGTQTVRQGDTRREDAETESERNRDGEDKEERQS